MRSFSCEKVIRYMVIDCLNEVYIVQAVNMFDIEP